MRSQTEGLGSQSTRIIVSRRRSGSSRLRAFKVVIDGVECAELRRRQVITVDVEPGEHIVFVKIDWGKSRPVRVQLGAGETVELSCRTRWTDVPLALWVITFGRNNYPLLERVS